jgi:hypothetical protein
MPLIFLRQEDCGGRAICLCYDPDANTRAKLVCGQQAEALDERKLILAAVMLVELSPVTSEMPAEESHRRLSGVR